jgi:hypothetical protein
MVVPYYFKWSLHVWDLRGRGNSNGQSLRLAYGVCEWCIVLAEQALSVLKLVFHGTISVDANFASALCSILAPSPLQR